MKFLHTVSCGTVLAFESLLKQLVKHFHVLSKFFKVAVVIVHWIEKEMVKINFTVDVRHFRSPSKH